MGQARRAGTGLRLHGVRLIARKLAPMPMYVCASPSLLKRYRAPTQPEGLREVPCIQFRFRSHRAVPYVGVLQGGRDVCHRRSGFAVRGEVLVVDTQRGRSKILELTNKINALKFVQRRLNMPSTTLPFQKRVSGPVNNPCRKRAQNTNRDHADNDVRILD